MSVERARQRRIARCARRPWQADAGVAHLAPAVDHLGPAHRRPTSSTRSTGCASRATARSSPPRCTGPTAGRSSTRGSTRSERLHLLRHDLGELVPTAAPAGIELRRGRRRDQDAALAVDRAAFTPFWRLDQAGLTEALTATTMVHFQVARDAARHRGLRGVRPVGPPRLRPAPRGRPRRPGAWRRRRAPRSTALRWLRRWGARDALVNTQEDNDRSLRLYQRTGFVLQPDGLAVLELLLDGPRPAPTFRSGPSRGPRPRVGGDRDAAVVAPAEPAPGARRAARPRGRSRAPAAVAPIVAPAPRRGRRPPAPQQAEPAIRLVEQPDWVRPGEPFAADRAGHVAARAGARSTSWCHQRVRSRAEFRETLDGELGSPVLHRPTRCPSPASRARPRSGSPPAPTPRAWGAAASTRSSCASAPTRTTSWRRTVTYLRTSSDRLPGAPLDVGV